MLRLEIWCRRSRSPRLCAHLADQLRIKSPSISFRNTQQRPGHDGSACFARSAPPRSFSSSSLARQIESQTVRSSFDVDQQEETDTIYTLEHGLRPPKARRKNPDAWLYLLEPFLPTHLRSSAYNGLQYRETDNTCPTIIFIISAARSDRHGSIDVLAHLGIQHDRWTAVLWLTNILLKNVAARGAGRPDERPPSNVAWADSRSLDEITSSPYTIDHVSYKSTEKIEERQHYHSDLHDSGKISKHKDVTMAQIWQSLGNLIIEAADRNPSEASHIMRNVYQIIAQAHHLGFVPDNVYTYHKPCYTSSLHRPPIMHLLSSRILTTLSDAVWRAHQDGVIAQAAKSGDQFPEISKDPPGGRFRLKVRDLGPEVWLEFVLWCCAEGGFAAAGACIIEQLRRKSQNPWFALHWTLSPGHPSSRASRIDWARVKLRHGGTVGQIEGYSRERPFVVMDSRTISAEVVLALADSIMCSVNVGIKGQGIGLDRARKYIKGLISFLEPHSLPSQFFDYLTVRMLLSGGFDVSHQPEQLQNFMNDVLELQTLETSGNKVRQPGAFNLEAIRRHSETIPGLLHQSLEALVEHGHVQLAVGTFSQITKFVDQSKLNSISAFLSTPSMRADGFFSSTTWPIDRDVAFSHGQLPFYKLAAFLDLVTDSRLLGLGNWMLYSEDVDGPLIPENAYSLLCLIPALARFATVSNDETLRQKVSRAALKTHRKTSVAVIRAFANSNMSWANFSTAGQLLQHVKEAKLGGCNAENVATLTAAILRVESQVTDHNTRMSSNLQQEGLSLLEKILQGDYDGVSGDFTAATRKARRLQTSAVLRILELVPDTALSELACSWRWKYGDGNSICLYVDHFNILLAAIVEFKGSKEGARIWNTFCSDPRDSRSLRHALEIENYMVMDQRAQDHEVDDDFESGYFLRTKDQRPPTMGKYVPIVPLDHQDDLSPRSERYPKIQKAPSYPKTSDISLTIDTNADEYCGESVPGLASLPRPSAGDSEVSLSRYINPVVVPDLRTLRIIVRGAVAERRKRQAHRQDTSEQDEVLEWSKQFYRAFGLRGRMVQQEIQQKVEDDWDRKGNMDDEKQAYETNQRILTSSGETVAARISRKFSQGRSLTKVFT